jgi:quinol-cytochrome oxidoreductase complex cytochrome b subunit
VEPAPETEIETEPLAPAAAVAVVEAPTEEPTAPEAPAPAGNGGGNGGGATRVAASVTPRPIATPSPGPEGVRTQRLLTVVKAKAIQKTKAEPTDKVSTWPHLMVAEFAALLAVTGLLIVMSVVLQAPLLEQANFNATPNPSKAPWYFLGLQELLSYFDPQIAGVTIPTIVGMFGFMAIPYVDRNPSNKPSDRKFAIFLYTFFIMGSGVLTILGVLFRGPGFNFTYPWADGIWFDDLKDWVNFE